jgi:hypothetical protein
VRLLPLSGRSLMDAIQWWRREPSFATVTGGVSRPPKAKTATLRPKGTAR